MLNAKILTNPVNWVKVPLMAATFMIGVFLLTNFVRNGLPKGETNDDAE